VRRTVQLLNFIKEEKSMEFDDETYFANHINDDINNNHSHIENIKLETTQSNTNDGPQLSSPQQIPNSGEISLREICMSKYYCFSI
jgi:hypothetical protein